MVGTSDPSYLGGSHLQCPHFGRLRRVDHLRSGVRDQPGQHGDTVSAKNTNYSSLVVHEPVGPATQEAEVGGLSEPREFEAAVSYDYATGRQPG